MKFLLSYWGIIAGIVAGALAGYTYYHYIGCLSGTCPITSQPLNSTVYGAVMGGLLLSMFRKPDKNQDTNQEK